MSWPHHIGVTHQPDWVVYVQDSEKFRLTNVMPERIIFVSRGITVYIYKPTFYMRYTRVCLRMWDVRSLKYGAWSSAVEHTIPLTSAGSITKFYSSHRWIQILEWLAKPRYTYIISIGTCCYFQGRAVSLSKPNSHLHIMSWTSSCRRSKRKKLCESCHKRYSRERASWRS
jgi:hypothetical protein